MRLVRSLLRHAPRPILLAGAALTTGCVPSIQAATSGQIGCPPDEITISDEQGGTHDSTWTATCRGEVFYCSSTTTFVAYGGGTTGSTTQYQCTPAVGARPAAAAPAPVAAAPTPAPAPSPSTSTPPQEAEPIAPRKDFPEKALGFIFGSSPKAAQTACLQQGHQWQPDRTEEGKFECSGTGVDVGVPVRSTLSYCAGELCELRAYATLADGVAGFEQLAKLQGALADQYGQPDKERTTLPTACRPTLPVCVDNGRAAWSRTWEWPGGSLIRARLFSEDGVAIVGVLYRLDREAAQIEQATESLNTDAF